MADEKTFISQLNEADEAKDTDIMIIEGEETKKISFLTLFNVFKNKFSKVYKPQTELTKAEYEALSEEEKNSGTMYLISDTGNIMYNGKQYSNLHDTAEEINYSNTSSGLNSGNVQGAIDEVNAKSVNNTTETSELKTKTENSGLTTLYTNSVGLTSYYVSNGMAVNLMVNGNYTGTIAAWGGIGLGTLPAGKRPKAKMTMRLIDNFMLVIQTSGAVNVQNASSTERTLSNYGIEGGTTFLI